MEKRKQGVALLLAAACLWSTSGVFLKLIVWNGFAASGLRSLIAAITLLPFVIKELPRAGSGRKRFRFTKMSFFCALAYAGTVSLFGLATKQTTAANAILEQYTAPVYAAILGYFLLKEPVSKLDIASIAVIFGGMGIFLSESLSAGHLVGDLLGLLSGVCFGALSVLLRLERDANPVLNVFWGNIFSFFLMLPFMGPLEFDFKSTVFVVLLGVFQLGLPYIMYIRGLRYVSALEGTIIPVIEPLLNPVWVMLLAGEIPSMRTVLGGLIVILGVTGRELVHKITASRDKMRSL